MTLSATNGDNSRHCLSRIVKTGSSNENWYLNCWQTTGATINMDFFSLQALRIK